MGYCHWTNCIEHQRQQFPWWISLLMRCVSWRFEWNNLKEKKSCGGDRRLLGGKKLWRFLQMIRWTDMTAHWQRRHVRADCDTRQRPIHLPSRLWTSFAYFNDLRLLSFTLPFFFKHFHFSSLIKLINALLSTLLGKWTIEYSNFKKIIQLGHQWKRRTCRTIFPLSQEKSMNGRINESVELRLMAAPWKLKVMKWRKKKTMNETKISKFCLVFVRRLTGRGARRWKSVTFDFFYAHSFRLICIWFRLSHTFVLLRLIT